MKNKYLKLETDYIHSGGFLFVDTSAITTVRTGKDYSHQIGRGGCMDKLGALKLDLLHKKFCEIDNIRTNSEVVIELNNTLSVASSNMHPYMKKEERIQSNQYTDNLSRMCDFLNGDNVNVDNMENNNLEGKMKLLLKKIDPIFEEEAGKSSSFKTDQRLIAAAIVSASSHDTGIFASDRPLLRTYARCELELGISLNPVFICDGISQKTYSAKSYLKRIPRRVR